jgi:endonuclease III
MSKAESRKPVKRTGSIWVRPSRVQSAVVTAVCRTLQGAYGVPRLGNPKKSVDDLLFIVISNKTTPCMARMTFQRLRTRYQAWDDMLLSPLATVRSVLRPAGLSAVKSRQLHAALRKIKQDFGRCDLRDLRRKTEAEIHAYLTSLPGVSDKVAKCVMMYTMGARVLPVDAHVHRVATRLGWTTRKRADQSHEELESLVPLGRRYAFHVDCVLHGREVCRPRSPVCQRCCINRYCEYFRKLNGKG